MELLKDMTVHQNEGECIVVHAIQTSPDAHLHWDCGHDNATSQKGEYRIVSIRAAQSAPALRGHPVLSLAGWDDAPPG